MISIFFTNWREIDSSLTKLSYLFAQQDGVDAFAAFDRRLQKSDALNNPMSELYLVVEYSDRLQCESCNNDTFLDIERQDSPESLKIPD